MESPEPVIIPDIHTQCVSAQKQTVILAPVTAPHDLCALPPTQIPPSNYTSCVSARMQRFVKTNSSGQMCTI